MTIDEMIADAADRYGLNPDLLRRQFKQESGLNPNAVSPKGALGIAQVMPSTGKAMGYSEEDLKDPHKSIEAGAKYMSQMYKHVNKVNPSLSGSALDSAVLATYNAGPTGAAKYLKSGDLTDLPDETRKYIGKIMAKNQNQSKSDPLVDDLVAAYNKTKSTPATQPTSTSTTVDDLANAFIQSKKENPTEQPQQPETSLLDQTKRQLGLTARYGIQGGGAGLGMLTDPVIEALGGAIRMTTGSDYHPETLASISRNFADILGLPQPQTNQEQIIGAATQGLAGAATPAGLAGQLLGKTSGATQTLAQNLSANPVVQSIAGATGATASEITRQEGGGQLAQLAAGLGAGLGGGLGAAKAGRVVQAAKAPTPQKTIIQEPMAQDKIPVVQEITPTKEISIPEQPAQPIQSIENIAQPKGLEELSALTKKAITKKSAQQELAAETMPNADTIEAAKRLGISEHLQPDHVTTSQSYRELAQAIKSFPGSELRAQEIEGLANVANRANKIIEDVAATKDISELSAKVKSEMSSTQQNLEQQAGKMYKDLREKMPANAEAPADNVLNFISKRAEDLGGIKNLSPMEKMIYSKLKPQTKVIDEQNPVMSGSGEVLTQKTIKSPPNYALLDDVRRDLTAARVKNQGVFKDADAGLIKILESKLKDDQGAVLSKYGLQDDFALAQKTVALRKSLEDDMISLFGKNLEGNIVSKLQSGIKNLSKGDTQKIEEIIKSVPENMRENVATSGLSYAFGKNAADVNFNSYANWYEGLKANKQAYDTLSKYVKPDVMKNLDDFYKVSNGIRLASRERIQTGRLNVVKDSLKDADTAIGKIYESVKGVAGKAVMAEIASSAVGAPGAGLASGITAALVKEKVPLQKAADKLMASDEFRSAVKSISEGAAKDAKKSFVISKVIESTPQWKEFFSKLPKEEQDKIIRVGVVQWLVTPKEKEKK